MMMGVAAGVSVIALAALVAAPFEGNTTIKLAQATGTVYSASFTGTEHPLAKLVQQTSYSGGDSYSASSPSGNDFHYAGYITGGTGIVNNTTPVGGATGLFAVLQNAYSSSASELVVGFAVNNITKFQLTGGWNYQKPTQVRISTSSTGYTNAMPTNWTIKETISTSAGITSFWGNEYTLDSTGSSNYQAFQIEVWLPAGGLLGFNVTVNWSC